MVVKAVSNTSPLLYLYRIETIHWLPLLFGEVWIPQAVVEEFKIGQQRGYNVPSPQDYDWLRIVNPAYTPSEWFALDLGKGELAAMALALENPHLIVLLDDMLARRTAQAAGLDVWGTLRILLEAKQHGLTESIKPHVKRLAISGMWLSAQVQARILKLAGEDK